MGLSVDSKIKDIKKNPEVVKIMERYREGFSTNPQMKMAQGLTFRKLASFPQSKAAGITDEAVANHSSAPTAAAFGLDRIHEPEGVQGQGSGAMH